MLGLKTAIWALSVAAAALAPFPARGREADPPAVAWTAFRAPVRFESISTEQGLSQSSAVAIPQARKGFLWFGTDPGLNRYDVNDFRIFRKDPSDPDSIGDSKVVTLLEDSRDLVARIDGGVRVENRDGTVYSIMFPAPEARESGGGDR
jgi:hypothetical protein